MNYNPTSSILFITICSLTKTENTSNRYTHEYDYSQTIAKQLTEAKKNDLEEKFIDTRKAIFQYIKKNNETLARDGVSDKYNESLVIGQDFGGSKTAQFVPAIYRYDGRFYKALGMEGRGKLLSSEHHSLFISGLYGVVRPLEPIQFYSVPVDTVISDKWKSDDLLTKVISTYIEKNKIQYVIDFSSRDIYRNLVNWEILRKKCVCLHCFDTMSSGDKSLPKFAEILKEDFFEMSEMEIRQRIYENEYKKLVFIESEDIPAGIPRENESQKIIQTDDQSQEAVKLPWMYVAEKDFLLDRQKNLDKAYEIADAVNEICCNPEVTRGDTIKALSKNLHGLWRYRIDTFRLIYEIDKKNKVIRLLRFGNRDDIYDELNRKYKKQ